MQRLSLFGKLLVVIDFAEGAAGDEGDGNSGDAFELHDDVLVALDALDGAFDACEVTVDDADTSSFLVEEVVGLQEENGIVLTGGYAHEVLHLVIGDTEDALVPGVGEVVGHVTHGLELPTGHLQVGEDGLRGTHEEQVGNGGDEHTLVLALRGPDQLVAHGKEVLDA